MHFPIIEILEHYQERGSAPLDFEDATINYWTDYYGEDYPEPARKELLKADWFLKYFDGIATVDPEKETITFLDKETIENTLNRYFNETLDHLAQKDCGVGIKFYYLRDAGYHYKDWYALFWRNGCGYTSMQFIEDALFYAGQTFKIGNIYDAHY